MTRLLKILPLLTSCSVPGFAQSKPLDLSLGWTYARADQGNGFAPLHGWYGTLNWEASPRLGIALQHQDYWGSFHHSGVNQHVWLGGLSVNLRKGNPKLMPFVQPLAGATRSSSSAGIEWQPTFQLGAGLHLTLKGNLSLELTPAEYALTFSHGSALNTYEAAAGLEYSFGK